MATLAQRQAHELDDERLEAMNRAREEARMAAAEGVTTTVAWRAVYCVSLSSFLYGYNTAVLNGAIVEHAAGSVLNDIELSVPEQEVATGLMLVSAMVASLTGSGPCDKYGRRRCLLWNNVLFMLGPCLSIVSDSAFMFMLGRLVVGLGVGFASVAAPVLIAEMAREHNRGKLTTMHQLFVTIGILFSGLVGYVLIRYVSRGWTGLVGFGILPAILQLLLKNYFPESPKWLIRNARYSEAKAAIAYLNPPGFDAEAEMEAIRATDEKESGTAAATWSDLFAMARPMAVGIVLMTYQPLSGINAVIFYSSDIFQFAGVTEALLSTTLVFGLNVAMTVWSAYLIDRIGRKTLLMRGSAMMTASVFLLGVSLKLLPQGTIQGLLAVTFVLTFVAGFAVGLGAVSWTILSEVLPTRVRSKGFSVFIGLSWVLNLIVSLTTLTIIDAFGGGKTPEKRKDGVSYMFWMFGGFSVIGLLCCHYMVPDGHTARSRGASLAGSRDRAASGAKTAHGATSAAGATDRRALLGEDYSPVVPSLGNDGAP